MSELLTINNLHVSVAETEILHGIDLKVNRGETHVIMGPNGAGKSTLGYAIMGNPNYAVGDGRIIFKGEDITSKETHERAKDGIFLSFQNPIEVPGISLSNFIRNAVDTKTGTRARIWDFRKSLEKQMELLSMDKSYADRDLNVGFSGGEKKKAEILQMLMMKPDLAILDETDSGLDVDAVRTVSDGVKAFHDNGDGALIIITHSTRILEALKVDYTHILVDGKIVKTGDASLVDEINKNGFESFTGNVQ
ncbi:MAG: Fe-S cluster assembly ATPase SufC [Eubacterium sp.]|nr:Fe-S cluster assembly ATPase SufC [Eubacterium sp.]